MYFRGFDCENETMTEYVQTRWYRAPELLCESPHYGRVSIFFLFILILIYFISFYFNILIIQ